MNHSSKFQDKRELPFFDWTQPQHHTKFLTNKKLEQCMDLALLNEIANFLLLRVATISLDIRLVRIVQQQAQCKLVTYLISIQNLLMRHIQGKILLKQMELAHF